VKQIFILLIFSLPLFKACANTYYVSTGGNDAANGTNVTTPWRSIAKVNIYTFRPGDFILFKRGDIFYGSITIKQSGSSGKPITFGSYGTGAKPVITGMTELIGWTNQGSDIYQTSCLGCQLDLRCVTIKDTFQPVGRYPAIEVGDDGYYYFQTSTPTSLTSNQIASIPNFIGGQLVIRNVDYELGLQRITKQTSTTLTFYQESGPVQNRITNNYGFFFQNHSNCLNHNGDWMYDSATKIIRIYSSNGKDTSNIKAATLPYLISIGSRSYITIDGLTLYGSDTFGIRITGTANNVIINYCTLKDNGQAAVSTASTVFGVSMSYDSLISNPNWGINGQSASDWRITNCVFLNTGMIRGMGQSGGEGYTAIYKTGHNAFIAHNQIINTGYIGIRFQKDSVKIHQNFISNYDMIMGDGGGIYTYKDSNYYGRIIDSNIVIYSGHAKYGTSLDPTNPYNNPSDHGIYFDNQASHALVFGNTVAYCSYGGIQMNEYSHDLIVQYNTFYNNTNTQIDFASNSFNSFTGDMIKHNILFASNADQLLLQAHVFGTATYASIGSCDSNIYARPIYEPTGINSRGYSHGGWTYPYSDGGVFYYHPTNHFYSLDKWKEFSKMDLHSVTTPFRIKNASRIRFEFNPTILDKRISLGNVKYKDVHNMIYFGTIDIPPYSSIILIPVDDIL
jgi:hypothetical protein